MSLLNDIGKAVNNKNFLLASLDVLFLILPGFIVLFVFRSDLLLSLDWIKLVLLSASITAPLAFLNVMILDSWEERYYPTKPMPFFNTVSIAIILSGFIMDVVLSLGRLLQLMGYSQGGHFNYQFIILVSIEGIMFLIALYYGRKRNSREKKEALEKELKKKSKITQ
jgi:hypothetical protein